MALGKCKRPKCNKQLRIRLLKFALSSGGLTILGPLYILAGAFLFIAIEKDANISNKEAQVRLDDDLAYRRKGIIDDINAFLKLCREEPELCEDFDPQSRFNQGQLLVYHQKFFTPYVVKYSYTGQRPDPTVSDWTFQSGLLYALSIITTIGYGNVGLSTDAGRITAMIYAVFAIPLLTMWMGSIAEMVNAGLSFLYYKILCGLCAKERIKTTLIRPRASRAFQTDWPLNKSHKNEDETISDEEMDEVEIDEYENIPESIPIALVLCVLMSYMIMGIVALAYWTGDDTSQSSLWSTARSGYFVIISLTTVGFGDFYPMAYKAPKLTFDIGCQLMFSTVYIIVGLALMSVFVQSLAERPWYSQRRL